MDFYRERARGFCGVAFAWALAWALSAPPRACAEATSVEALRKLKIALSKTETALATAPLTREALALPSDEMKQVLSFALLNNTSARARQAILQKAHMELDWLNREQSAGAWIDNLRRYENLADLHYLALRDADPANRALATTVFLIRAPDKPELRESLRKQLFDADHSVRGAAIDSFRHCSKADPRFVSAAVQKACRETILKMIKDPLPDVSAAGLACALHFPDFGILPQIERFLKTGTPRQRSLAIAALAYRPGPEALELKRYAIEHTTSVLQGDAIASLAGNRPEEITPILAQTLADPRTSQLTQHLINSNIFTLDAPALRELWRQPAARLSVLKHLMLKLLALPPDQRRAVLNPNLALLADALELPGHNAAERQARDMALDLYARSGGLKGWRERIEQASTDDLRRQVARELGPALRAGAAEPSLSGAVRACLQKARGVLELFSGQTH